MSLEGDSDADLAAFDERTLRSIIRGSLAVTGEALFRSTATQLTALLGARAVLIAELLPDAPLVRPLVTLLDGTFVSNLADAFAGAPWCELLAGGTLHIERDAHRIHAEDAYLGALAADQVVGVPLVADGQVVGLIAVIDPGAGAAVGAHAITSTFGRAVGAEIARLRRDRLERERSIAVLSHRSALLELAQMDKSTLSGAIARIVRTDAATLGVERVSYWSLADDGSLLTCEELYQSSTGTSVRGAVLRAVDFPAYFQALLSTESIAANDAHRDPRTAEFTDAYFVPNGIGAMLDIPVWRHGRVVGVLCHEHVGGARSWRDDESDFAVSAAGLCSIAIEASQRREAEMRFELITRATNDVIWDWDLGTNAVLWSAGVDALFRYRQDQVEPTLGWFEHHVHPDDLAQVMDTLSVVLAGSSSTWSSEYRVLRGDGTVGWVTDRGHVVRDEGGKPLRMLGAMTDVTERKAIEVRLHVADRMASIGTLAAGVAHEINNPLAYILANLDYALENLSSNQTEVGEALREAREGGIRVSSIVRELRAFSRIEEEERGPVDVSRAIESSIKMAWTEVRHRARLVKELAATPTVHANEARLAQVVLNLLVNAAQAIPEGAVEDNEIRVCTGTDARGYVTIEVRDTGPGIPTAIRGRVFDPFFTTKPVGLGTGLGLSSCHSVVASLGGEITIGDAPGGGCAVRVCLPPSSSRDVEPVPQSPATAPPVKSKRPLLLIDDDVGVGKATHRLLAKHWDVEVVTSARDALSLVVNGQPFDVVLCDLMMPDMTGMDLHAELARVSPQLAERTVFMTGGTFTQRAQDFLARVTNPRLEKPFDRPTLLAALELAAAVGRA